MADQLDVSPTQGNLLRLQDELEQIRGGHDLLDRKQEVLTQRLLETIAEAEAVEAAVRERFEGAHEAMARARMQMGRTRLRRFTLAPTAEVEATVKQRSIMGTKVPAVQVEVTPHALPYGLGETDPALDEARERWLAIARRLGEAAEKVTTVWRLALELRQTQRRVNALESTIMPRYENTINFIEQTLEEENREDILRAKKVKEGRRQ